MINATGNTKKQAEEANQAFDTSVKRYLRNWIEDSTPSTRDGELASDTEEFIEQGALRSFFKHRDDAFEQLLADESIARHLLRPASEVCFQHDAYEPMLAKFEKRIYNLAAHREHLEVSFRYSPTSRQGAHGDTIELADMPADDVKEDIGTYFGTRRSDETTLGIIAAELRWEAAEPNALPIHVIAEGHMEESLRAVRRATEQLRDAGDNQLHCFVIQRRHAGDDRHLGAALLIMQSQHPEKPERIVFCDTLNPTGTPPWWHSFKRKVDNVFPPEADAAPVSDMLEDGGIKLQRLHDSVPVRHQDIDCAFYTFSMARALIQLAKLDPRLIVSGSIEDIVSQMTGRMPEYFERPNHPKVPTAVREENILRRWNMGREAMLNIIRNHAVANALHKAPAPDAVVQQLTICLSQPVAVTQPAVILPQ